MVQLQQLMKFWLCLKSNKVQFLSQQNFLENKENFANIQKKKKIIDDTHNCENNSYTPHRFWNLSNIIHLFLGYWGTWYPSTPTLAFFFRIDLQERRLRLLWKLPKILKTIWKEKSKFSHNIWNIISDKWLFLLNNTNQTILDFQKSLRVKIFHLQMNLEVALLVLNLWLEHEYCSRPMH